MEKDIATFRASTRRWLFGSFAGWLTLLLMPVGLGVLIFLLTWLKNVGIRYELTDQRLIIKSGILMKRIDEIELYRVKDVTVDFSLLNQIVDIGTISLRSSDTTTKGGAFQLVGVPRARELREQLRTLVDQARRKRGVRELDVDRDEFH